MDGTATIVLKRILLELRVSLRNICFTYIVSFIQFLMVYTAGLVHQLASTLTGLRKAVIDVMITSEKIMTSFLWSPHRILSLGYVGHSTATVVDITSVIMIPPQKYNIFCSF